MKNKRNYYILLLSLFALHACDKLADPTIINLTVVDYFTGEPLDSVSYSLEALYRNDPPGEKKPGDPKWGRGGITDGTGKIQYTFGSDEDGLLHSLYKKDYFFKSIVNEYNNEDIIKQSTHNDFNVKMRPYDAFLKINLHNNKSEKDSLFLLIKSTTIQSEEGEYSTGLLLSYPVILAAGIDTTCYIPTVASEPLNIYWSWDKLNLYDPKPLKDQIVISKNDTLSYPISN